VWNRLEGRPRTVEFDRALQAEVRDALWMLARQWQFGEFRGEDAGSPITATFHLRTTRPTRYRAQEGTPVSLPERQPPESVGGRRPVRFTGGRTRVSGALRRARGRRWRKVMSPHPPTVRDKIMDRWPIRVPDPNSDADVPLVAHPEVWATMRAVAGRILDG